MMNGQTEGARGLHGSGQELMRGAADGGLLVNPRLARPVPRDRVIVLVQRFFLLDTDRLRPHRLWLGKVFFQAFMALAVHLVADRLPYLHQGTGKIKRIHDVAEGDPNQRLQKKVL